MWCSKRISCCATAGLVLQTTELFDLEHEGQKCQNADEETNDAMCWGIGIKCMPCWCMRMLWVAMVDSAADPAVPSSYSNTRLPRVCCLWLWLQHACRP